MKISKFVLIGVALILSLNIAIIIFSDGRVNASNLPEEVEIHDFNSNYSISVIDGCEYIIYGSYSSGIHKGNCKNHK